MLKKILLLSISIILSICLLSCSKNSSNKEQEESDSSILQEEPPQKLMDIEENIQSIIIELAKPEPALKEEQKKQEEQSKDLSEESKNSDKEEKEKESSEDEEKKDKQEEEKQEEKDQEEEPEEEASDIFMTLSSSVDKIHTNWNEYFPKLSKINKDENLTKDFSTALNDMTNTILAKDKKGSLLAANYLYSFMPKFFMLYPKFEQQALTKDMRYYVRDAVLYSTLDNNWNKALEDTNNLMMQWDSIKTITKSQNNFDKSLNQDENILLQIEYAYTELKSAIYENNANIAEIKGNIALKLIDEYEKKLKDNQESEKEQK